MFGRLMPREGRFFDLFNEHAEQIVEGSRELAALMTNGDDLQRRTVTDDLCFHVPFTVGNETFSVEFLMVTKKQGGTGVQNSLVGSMAKA